MATAKRDLTNPPVQGPRTVTLEEASRRLDCTRRSLSRFLSENRISYVGAGDQVAIDATEFEAALRVQAVAVDTELASAARDLVQRARAAQGLPAKITQPSVISRIVALLQPDCDE